MTITSSVAWRRVLAAALLAAPLAAWTQPAPPSRHLLIVVDGLRPDYVTEAVMPNLVALGQRGVVFAQAPFRLSHGHARQRLVYLHRRVPGTPRADGEQRVLSQGRSGKVPRHFQPRRPDEDCGGRRAVADGGHAWSIAAGRWTKNAGRQLGLDRVGVSQQSHGLGRCDSAS